MGAMATNETRSHSGKSAMPRIFGAVVVERERRRPSRNRKLTRPRRTTTPIRIKTLKHQDQSCTQL